MYGHLAATDFTVFFENLTLLFPERMNIGIINIIKFVKCFTKHGVLVTALKCINNRPSLCVYRLNNIINLAY